MAWKEKEQIALAVGWVTLRTTTVPLPRESIPIGTSSFTNMEVEGVDFNCNALTETTVSSGIHIFQFHGRSASFTEGTILFGTFFSMLKCYLYRRSRRRRSATMQEKAMI